MPRRSVLGIPLATSDIGLSRKLRVKEEPGLLETPVLLAPGGSGGVVADLLQVPFPLYP